MRRFLITLAKTALLIVWLPFAIIGWIAKVMWTGILVGWNTCQDNIENLVNSKI